MELIQNGKEKFENQGGRAEVERLVQENQQLSDHLEELNQALSEVAKTQEALRIERDALQAKCEEIEKCTKAAGPGNSQSNTESKLTEAQSELRTLRKTYETEVNKLQDDIHVYKEQVAGLLRLESQIETYKKRMEDSSVYKRKLSESQELNKTLQDKVKQLEEATAGALNTKQSLNYYKEQLTDEKARVAMLSLDLSERTRTIQELNNRATVQEGRRKNLKAQLNLYKAGVPNEESLQKLREESESLREQLTESPEPEARKVPGEKLQQVSKHNKSLLKELAFSRKELEDSRSKLAKLKRELSVAEDQAQAHRKQLDAFQFSASELTKVKNERDSHISDLTKLFKEKDQLNQTLLECKEELHQLQNALTQAETALKTLERDKENLHNKLKEATESERITLDQLKVQQQAHSNENTVDMMTHLQLQRDNLKLDGEISTLKLQLLQKDDTFTTLRQEKGRNEAELRAALVHREEALNAAHEEELRTLTALLAQKDLDASYLSKQKEDLAGNHNKEIKLMSMVVHNVGLEIVRLGRSAQPRPES